MPVQSPHPRTATARAVLAVIEQKTHCELVGVSLPSTVPARAGAPEGGALRVRESATGSAVLGVGRRRVTVTTWGRLVPSTTTAATPTADSRQRRGELEGG
ncbi:hypothetical protein GCM10022244_05130 [Streptomyces gulbargensis]|uniref:Uncharacterized protein n=1 Tax=Streptomyces gulbargensis TaxID=364901 RepID=A0ABP7LE19_9ACTN